MIAVDMAEKMSTAERRNTASRRIKQEKPMTIARHVIFALCLALAIAAVILTAPAYFENRSDQFMQVLFCALCVLISIGILAFLLQFVMRRISTILTSVFFGFLAGVMATNFASDVVSQITYDSWAGYLMGYGMMALVFALAIAGLVLNHPAHPGPKARET